MWGVGGSLPPALQAAAEERVQARAVAQGYLPLRLRPFRFVLTRQGALILLWLDDDGDRADSLRQVCVHPASGCPAALHRPASLSRPPTSVRI